MGCTLPVPAAEKISLILTVRQLPLYSYQYLNAMTSFCRTDSDNTDFISLVALLDADLRIRDGEEHAFYAQFNKTDAIRHVIVCYVDDQPIGCGAFRPYDETTTELKRMFVQPAYRGKGIGFKIVRELELWAAECNYSACILETGKNQPEAIGLYQKAGYAVIPSYGQYLHIENSVCMKKNIA